MASRAARSLVKLAQLKISGSLHRPRSVELAASALGIQISEHGEVFLLDAPLEICLSTSDTAAQFTSVVSTLSDAVGKIPSLTHVKPTCFSTKELYGLLGGTALSAGGYVLMSDQNASTDAPETQVPSLEKEIESLKKKLGSATEKSGQLERENQKLREEAAKESLDEKKMRLEYEHRERELIIHHVHEENMEKHRLKLKEGKEDGESGDDDADKDNKGEKSNKDDEGKARENKDEKDKKDGEDKEGDKDPFYKRIYSYFQIPGKLQKFYDKFTNNLVSWGLVVTHIPRLLSLTKDDWKKVAAGELQILFKRAEEKAGYFKIEFPEVGTCTCGHGWPDVCSKCGKVLPSFAPDVPRVVSGLKYAPAIGK